MFAPGAFLRRRVSLDRQSVDIGLHQRTQGRVDGAVARQRVETAKGLGDNFYGKMSTPVARAGMPNVLVALIKHQQRSRRKGGAQQILDHRLALGRNHGNTLRNGRTITS